MKTIVSNTLLRVAAQSHETVVPSPPCATWTFAEMKFRLVYTLHTQIQGAQGQLRNWGCRQLADPFMVKLKRD